MAIPRKQRLRTRWNEPGVVGFFNWIEDVKPCILHADRKYRPVRLECWQREILADALAADASGRFVFSLLLTCMPRRHSKTTLWALVVLWLFTSRENQTIQLLGNSDGHCNRVQFRPLKGIIEHTPVLRRMIRERDIQTEEIIYPELGGRIIRSARNVSVAFGDKLSLLWVSDLHAAPDLEAYDAYQAALLDSEDALILIDANTDAEGGPIHALETEALTDPGIYAKRIEYANFEEYSEKAPAWIDRDKARRQAKTQLPAAFDRDILGKRGSGKYALFPEEVIQGCQDSYQLPVEDLRAIAQGREYVVTGGLDRSKTTWTGDNTVWTVTMKVANPQGEPDVYILNQERVYPNTSALIKKAAQRDHERYGLNNVVMEDYEVGDLEPWFVSQKISVERISAHNKNQNVSFLELHRVAQEGRLRLPGNAEKLIKELRTFHYQEGKNGQFTFGSLNKKKFKDDRVYSLNWSQFAARRSVLASYVLGNIHCTDRSSRKRFCVLLGGQHRLSCADTCPAFQELLQHYRNYSALTLDADLPLHDFMNEYVSVQGAKVYQAA